MSTSAKPVDIPRASDSKSPPIDPAKLNQAPAPLPPVAADQLSDPAARTQNMAPTSPPLRSPEGLETGGSSSYLDEGEVPQHPTVAETGVLATSPSTGPEDRSGQLKRVEGGERHDGIIKLGSFGGEGLTAKPPHSANHSGP